MNMCKGTAAFHSCFPQASLKWFYQTSLKNSCRAWRTQVEVAALLLPEQLFVLGCFDLW